jgi:hypothetical protein
MSAYIASPPVTARKAAPRTAKLTRKRAQRGEHRRRLDDAVDAECCEHREPSEHDRSEDLTDEAGALLLHDKQPHQDDDGERHDRRRQRGRVDLQAFDRAEHGDRRRDRAVAIEQGGADETDDEKLGPPCAGLGIAGVQQRQ